MGKCNDSSQEICVDTLNESFSVAHFYGYIQHFCLSRVRASLHRATL